MMGEGSENHILGNKKYFLGEGSENISRIFVEKAHVSRGTWLKGQLAN